MDIYKYEIERPHKALIVIPKDKVSMEKLDYNEADDSELIQLKLNGKLFYELFNTGIFERINSKIGCCIDNFESESITDMKKILETIELVKADSIYAEGKVMLLKLLDEAYSRNTGIFFFF